MCDIVFITPNMDGDIAAEAMGTLQLMTILKQNGMECDVLPFFRIGDVAQFDQFLENAMQMIAERKPKIVSFLYALRCVSY